MTKYFTEHTGFAGAIDCLSTIGGQLFCGKGLDSASTVMSGKNVYTFWQPNSKSYAKCRQVAQDVGFPHEHFTSGRIGKYILKEVCGVKQEAGKPDPIFIRLARDGFHWHYTHIETGYHPYLMEFDLCAAYATSLGQYESLYFSMSQKTIADDGVMQNLRVALQSVPKWMRMILIGQLTSHRMTFATMPNRKQGDCKLKWTTISNIPYGYAFNQAHRAVLRVYRILEAIHRIGGIHVKRMHTDSFALSPEISPEAESEIFQYLDSQGFSYSLKAQGTAHFFCLNSGIIGRKFVGVPFEIRDSLKALPQKPRRLFLTPEQLERWGVRGVVDDAPPALRESSNITAHQLELGLTNERPDGRIYERFA